MLYPNRFSRALMPVVFAFAAAAALCGAPYRTTYVVAQDGSGDFRSIQEAIDDCKSFPYEPVTIRVKPGEYWGRVTVPAWNTKLRIVGEGEVTLVNDLHFKSVGRGRNSTFMTATLEVLADEFTAVNLRIVNAAGPIGQALALRVEGDRSAFFNCRLEGNQDTLYVAGDGNRNYFKDCRIEGTTDFIFGEATAFFEACEILAKADSYITAASTREGREYGLVFKNCILRAEEGIEQVYLGRPWRMHAKTVFLNCEYGDFVAAERWGSWGLEDPGATVYYAEYFGEEAPSAFSERADWTHALSDEEAARYDRERVLRGWQPIRQPTTHNN